MIHIASLLTTSLLFGGMMLYSFGFAPLVFTALPGDVAGGLLRRAFPHYYLFVFGTALVAGLELWPRDTLNSALMVAVAVIAAIARQMLMPSINAARDAGSKSRFDQLHG